MEKVMEYILQADKFKSFSKAAEAVFISQPALSAMIRKEEERLQARLFDRSVKPLRLTAAGEHYVAAAKKIARIEARLSQTLAAAGHERRRLVIGSSAFFFENFINKLISDFQSRQPQAVQCACVEASTEAAQKMLQKRELDVVITAHSNSLRGCALQTMRTEKLVLAVPAAFSINKQLSGYALSLQDINSGAWQDAAFKGAPLHYFGAYPFILHKKSKDMYKRTMRLFRKYGLHPRIVAQIEDFYTLYFLARSGQGIVLLRDSLLQYLEPTPALVFYKIDDELATRNINIYYNCRQQSPLVRSFIACCTEAAP